MATRNCARCGTPFQLRPQGQHAKFCSTACRVAASKQRNLEQTTLVLQVGGVTITIADLPKHIDPTSLRQTILETCGEELLAAIKKLYPQPIGETK